MYSDTRRATVPEELLVPKSAFDPVTYIPSSEVLYQALAGHPDGKATDPNDKIVYFAFTPQQVKTDAQGHTYLVDAFGNSFGYSTRQAVHPESQDGYNSTFDLWSTGGSKPFSGNAKWFTNW